MNATGDMNQVGPTQLLYDVADMVLGGVQGMMVSRNVSDFMDSVRWNEPFIRGLLLGQIILFAITFATRKVDIAQFAILLMLTAITLGAERLNRYGSENWSRFASQNYFDSSGLFMMVFVSGPFVILANFIVIGMALRLVKLYAKRARVRAQTGQQQSDKKDT